MEDVLRKWEITKEAITFISDCANVDQAGVLRWLEDKWVFATTFQPFKRGYSNFENKMLFNSATGGVADATLAKYMMFEKADYSTFINHYMDNGWHKRLCIQDIIFNTPEEACKAYKLDPAHTKQLSERTGLPIREIIVAMSLYGKQVIQKEEKRKRQEDIIKAQYDYNNKVEAERKLAEERRQQLALQQRQKANKSEQVKSNPQKQQVQPKQQSKTTLAYNNTRYLNYDQLTKSLVISKAVLAIDLQNGLSLEKAVDRQLQLKRMNSKTTHNSMTVDGIFYSNLKLVCTAYHLDNMEVSYYKSNTKCTAYDAVMNSIYKKYGQNAFSRL